MPNNTRNKTSESMQTHVDLFCGPGGFSLGMACKDDRVIGVDINQAALATFQHNMEHYYRTVETIKASLRPGDPGELDPRTLPARPFILRGSPPCKTFSGMAAYKHGQVKDTTLVNAFLHARDLLQPRWWVMENVIGLMMPGARIYRANEFGLYHERPRKVWGNFPSPVIGPVRRVVHPTILSGERQVGLTVYGRVDSCGRFFGRHLHPGDLQILMGFPAPPYYEFLGRNDAEKIQQIGNAVCPPVARAIYWAIMNHGRSVIEYYLQPASVNT